MNIYLKALRDIEILTGKLDYKSDYEIIDEIREILFSIQKCPNCHSWVEFTDKYCSQCGNLIGVDN